MNHEKRFIAQSLREQEKILRIEAFRVKNELKAREKALCDFERESFISWLEEDRPKHEALLEERGYRAASDIANEPLPYQKTKSYIKKHRELEEALKCVKQDSIIEYDLFCASVEGERARQLNANEYKRFLRVKERVRFMFSQKRRVFFLTFTFRDEVLTNNSEKQLKKAVLRYVRDNCEFYIVNKDIGELNERLHYHAVAIAKNDFVNMSEWSKKYGFAYYRICGKTHNDEKILSLYVTKLARHAVKKSASSEERLVYCRKFGASGI